MLDSAIMKIAHNNRTKEEEDFEVPNKCGFNEL
jgi:hypothetical protein